jgi:hypothetical protein
MQIGEDGVSALCLDCNRKPTRPRWLIVVDNTVSCLLMISKVECSLTSRLVRQKEEVKM